MSDEARRLYHEESNLFEAANKEFKGNYNKFYFLPSPSHVFSVIEKLLINDYLFVELPEDSQLHDLASLSAIDSKNLDPE